MSTDTTTTTAAPVETPAPVKRARKANPPAPDFNFGAVKPKAAAAPQRGSGRPRQDNPVLSWLSDSWANRKPVGTANGRPVEMGAGRSVTIPTANVVQLKNFLNYAARDLGVGVAIESKDIGGGKTEVRYAAKTRKQKVKKDA